MTAPKGNKFWEKRSSHGRNPIFETEDDLWCAACEYFEWVEKNPLWEEKSYMYQGKPVRDTIAKMRAMTLDGLQVYLDISHTTWQNYRAKEDFVAVTTRIEKIMREQKFTGAAAELLNPNIIARDLGLADKSELSGKDGGPILVNRIELVPLDDDGAD